MRLNELGIPPNFFTSIPYLSRPDLKVKTAQGWMYIVDDNGMAVLPAIPMGDKLGPYPTLNYWSDFCYDYLPINQSVLLYRPEFLDYEFIYDPKSFNNLSGGKWEVFRKNISHWLRKKDLITYTSILTNKKALHDLVSDFIFDKKDRLEDGEFLFDFIFDDQEGVSKKYIYYEDKLIAVNAWDDNYMYINFRLCIVDQSQAFLSEFARYLFYTDSGIQESGKMVNDGGCLGNKGLEKFKKKLNPISSRKVYSWLKNDYTY